MIKNIEKFNEKTVSVNIGLLDHIVEIPLETIDEHGEGYVDVETLKYYTSQRLWTSLSWAYREIRENSTYSNLTEAEQIVTAVRTLSKRQRGLIKNFYSDQLHFIQSNPTLLTQYNLEINTLIKYLTTASGLLRLLEPVLNLKEGKAIYERIEHPTPEELLQIIQQLESENPPE